MNKVILFVDDDADLRKWIKVLLDIEGYDVLEAEDGIEALKILKSNPVDLLISDILMPKMNGVELSIKVKHIKPNLKIIGLSGGGRLSAERVQKTSKKFFDRFLTKPFTNDELRSEVEMSLA